MQLLYIGAGFVGSCSAAVAGESGHTALVFDIDEARIRALSSGDRDEIEGCLYEKGLGDLLVRNKERVTFTSDYTVVSAFLDSCDAVFMCLPTPEIAETGESDLSFYQKAAETLGEALAKRNGGMQSKYVVVVNKSTVPIETADKTTVIFETHGVKNYGVASNPEFLVEGKAIEGSLKPDRIVVGASTDRDFEVMRSIYQRFYDATDVSYIEVNPREAAAGKLLANFYLFTKLALCFDVIGRTSEAFDGIKFENLRKIISSDKRIGGWGMYDSLYAGGSCLIKDARSLAHQLQTTGFDGSLVTEVFSANERQLDRFLGRATTDASISWAGKKVALLGTAFKRDTNDTRNSPSFAIARFCLEQGVDHISVYDPMAIPMFQKFFDGSSKVDYTAHEFDAIKNADVIIIATDWPQFRGLADVMIGEMKNKKPLIMDGRRMLQHRYTDLQDAGFDIIAVGTPFLKGKRS